jgi:glutaminyl-peptide cyclotransferase
MIKRIAILLSLILLTSTLSLTINAQRPDAPEYALRGPYTVGVQEYIIEGEERPLETIIWYPALNTENEEESTDYTFDNVTFNNITLHNVLFATGQAIRDAAPDLENGPYPLVIFSHGSGGMNFQSTFLTEHLASHGFVVIAPNHPTNTIVDSVENVDAFVENLADNFIHRPNDILRLIDHTDVLAEEGGQFAGLIDMEHIAISGHSFGGYTAMAIGGARLNFNLSGLGTWCEANPDRNAEVSDICLPLDSQEALAEIRGLEEVPLGPWPTTTDTRISAIVGLAPWNGPIFDSGSMADITIPTLIIVGTKDTSTPPERDAYLIFNGLTQAPKVLVAMENAGHYIFANECPPLAAQMGLYEKCSDLVWDMERAQDIIKHTTTAFLLSVLYDNPQASLALQPRAIDFPGVQYARRNMGVVPEILVPEVVTEYPHDTNAFTQGILLHEGTFYESTGRIGTLRQVELTTGEILRSVDVPVEYFAEGLALVDDKLIQLTWQAEEAIVYDLKTFEVIDTFSYPGEGWGLCFDGQSLYRSDGSDIIFQHDPDTFEITGQIYVTVQDEPVLQINELECVGDDIYANVWQTDYILQIEKATGYVNAVIDASRLLTAEERSALESNAVLNGIAYDEENDVFYITGKLWPKIFEVNFVAQ